MVRLAAACAGRDSDRVNRLRSLSRRTRLVLLAGMTLGAVLATALAPRFAQPLWYHHFADARKCFGVPNGLNVLSNLPFAVVGLWGLVWLARNGERFLDARERWPYVVFFAGVALTCFGSSYYHLDPNNQTLLWDRLFIVVAFMGLLSALMAERISVRAGMLWLAPLLAIGAGSTFYWEWSEMAGRGDLRWYALVQGYGVLLVLLLLALFRPRYDRGQYFVYAVIAYVVAKVLETFDSAVYHALGGTVSGHSLKHLAAALAGYYVLRMLELRRPVESAAQSDIAQHQTA